MKITVTSFNLHSGIGMDKIIDYPRIAKTIKASHADLAGLQEISIDHPFSTIHDPLALLGEILEMEGVFGETISPEYQGKIYHYGIGSLSGLEILEKNVLMLPNREGAELRAAIFLTVKSGEKTFCFINTHLDCTEGEEGDLLRKEQMEAILAQWQKMGRNPAILTGDFNASPASSAVAALKEQKWTLVRNNDFTFPSDLPDRKIDYIAFAPEEAFREEESSVIADSLSSDHRPLTATLELLF